MFSQAFVCSEGGGEVGVWLGGMVPGPGGAWSEGSPIFQGISNFSGGFSIFQKGSCQGVDDTFRTYPFAKPPCRSLSGASHRSLHFNAQCSLFTDVLDRHLLLFGSLFKGFLSTCSPS